MRPILGTVTDPAALRRALPCLGRIPASPPEPEPPKKGCNCGPHDWPGQVWERPVTS